MTYNIQCKPVSGSVLLKQKRINTFNFPFTMNPTTGCLFGCRYCYLQGYPFNIHAKFGVEMFYRDGYITKLKKDLEKHRSLPQHLKRIQIGPACEVYHPLVAKHIQNNESDTSDISLMRNILGAFIEEQKTYKSIWAVHLVTKSNLILSDIDLLKHLSCFQAEITVTTLEENAKTIWEGSSPSVKVRLNTIEKLSEEGIFTRVMAMPLFVKPDQVERLQNLHKGEDEKLAEALERERWKSADEIWTEAQKRGAKAFKAKGMNYFAPELLLKGEMRRIKGRNEDPNKEKLINSGEIVTDNKGKPKTNKVRTWEYERVVNSDGTFERTNSGNFRKAFRDYSKDRLIMNFGYRLMPKVMRLAWGDCT